MSKHTTQSPQLEFTFEEWRDIPGYESLYQISDHGNVKRLPKLITTKRGHTQTHHGVIKKLGIKSGYRYLWLFRQNQGRKYYVHELVALTFIGPRPSGYDVHHVNQNRLDNRPGNLEYLENHAHKTRHNRGEASGAAKITEADVRRIRELRKTMRVIDIVRLMGLSYPTVSQVVSGRTWSHVK